MSAGHGRADEMDDQYLAIFNLIEDADTLNAAGKTAQALTKYRQAAIALQKFGTAHADWNPKVVAFRLQYLQGKVAALEKPAESATPAEGTKSAGAVKLLEPGAEPRAVLRLHPKAGDHQTVVLTVKAATETKMGDMPAPSAKIPAMLLTLDLTVKDVSSEGNCSYELTVSDAAIGDDADVLPQVAEPLKAMLASMKGASGTGTVSSQGENRGMTLKAPAGKEAQGGQILDQLKESMPFLVTPLPEEAVGTGAKWQVNASFKTQGMTLTRSATYQLVSVDGDVLKTSSTMIPGQTLDLIKLTGTGTADRTADLNHVLPTQLAVDSHSESNLSITAAGQKQAISIKTDLKVSLEAK